MELLLRYEALHYGLKQFVTAAKTKESKKPSDVHHVTRVLKKLKAILAARNAIQASSEKGKKPQEQEMCNPFSWTAA